MYSSRPDDRYFHGFLNVFYQRRQLPSPYLKMAAIDRTDPRPEPAERDVIHLCNDSHYQHQVASYELQF